jgi:hypothetical protein
LHATEEAASAAEASAPASLAPKKITMKKTAAPSKPAFLAAADDEEAAPKREMILLEYSADELRAMADQTQQYLAHADDHESLEDTYRSKKGASLLAGSPLLVALFV